MILLALGLIGFGIGDLVRWSPDAEVSSARIAAATVCGAGAVALVAALSGMAVLDVIAAAVLAALILAFWLAYDLIPMAAAKPEYALGLLIATLVGLVAVSGMADPVEGEVAIWYSRLGFGFPHAIPVDQFVLGIGATLFLLATGNRIVRFTLAATKSPVDAGESTLRGGRVIGPMERVLVAASVVSSGLAGAGFVIAAKGLLRFRELTQSGDETSKVDSITEYFLIGTFTSILVAGIAALFVLAAA